MLHRQERPYGQITEAGCLAIRSVIAHADQASHAGVMASCEPLIGTIKSSDMKDLLGSPPSPASSSPHPSTGGE